MLIVSGFFHDISRSNDKSDPEHGISSAAWMNDNKEEIRKKYNLFYDANDFQKIV